MRRILAMALVLSVTSLFSQEYVPFKVRKQENLKGGIKMIGNQILNAFPSNESFNRNDANDGQVMKYVDIDSDELTFSSSAATLTFNNPTCSKVRYAGLYWGGMYMYEDEVRKSIKFKLPSETDYLEIYADSYVYDSHILGKQFENRPYICYKDVTALMQNGNPSGEYIVANVRAYESEPNQVAGGVSAGWSLVVIYEDPNETSKHVTTFDGYASVSAIGGIPNSVYFSFSGFKTLPAPLPVKARFGVMALEGDRVIAGDKLSIRRPDYSYFDLSDSVNPSDNFFNSTISYEGQLLTSRRPASTNTLGWDIDLFSIPNSGNTVIENDQTSATFKAHSTQDLYNIFFAAFEVEVIEPKMNLLKTVEDVSGTILNGQSLALGSTVYYGLEFQNVGNDNAIDYQIKDILPKNVSLDTTIPFEIPSGSGITYTVAVNSSGETEVTFNVPDLLVAKDAVKQKVRFAVKLSADCNDFSLPCSEKIANKAYSIYKGDLNRSLINDNGSFSSVDSCNLGTLEDTTFFANISSCPVIQQIELLCGENLTLTADSGYDEYEWKDANNQVIGNQRSVIVSLSGRYTVSQKKNGCVTRSQSFDVSTVQRQSENPLIPYAGEVFTCSSTQKTFAQIFLCGAGASKGVNLSAIANISGVEWQKYVGSQSVDVSETCPPEGTSVWSTVHTGKSITLNEEGIFRVLLTFQNGCVATYYYRVHTSPIAPVISTEMIYCGDKGKINVTNTNLGYEYAVKLKGTSDTLVYQDTPVFYVEQVGVYEVFVRKKGGLQADCVFHFDDISITKLEQRLQILDTQNESCSNQKDGSISFNVSNGRLPYTAVLKNQLTGAIQSVSIATHTETTIFDNLSPADYQLTVSDSGSCEDAEMFTVQRAYSLDFELINQLQCIENKTISQIEFVFEDTTLNLSELSIRFDDSPTVYNLQSIEGNRAFLYPLLTDGTHQVIVTHNGCTVSRTFEYQFPNTLLVSQNFEEPIVSAIRVSARGGSGSYRYYFNGVYQNSNIYYLRSFDQGYTNADGQEVKQIQVRVEDHLGCYVEQIFEEVFYDIRIPPYFTPDGNGINDTWSIKNALGYKNMRIHIFDREGRKITTLTPSESWDGTSKGKPLPSGDYWFQLIFNELRDRRIYIGHFTLYR